MSYEIKLFELPDQPVLVMRTVTPVEKLPEFFGKAFSAIMARLAALGEQPSGMPYGAYYNLDMKALDVEAGFPVSKKLPDEGELKCTIIPGGKYVTTVHRGSYDTMVPAYNALNEWIKDNGYEATGIAYEYYLNDPSADPSIVAETEVRLPVK
jgi:effector-binding domain-containing protein